MDTPLVFLVICVIAALRQAESRSEDEMWRYFARKGREVEVLRPSETRDSHSTELVRTKRCRCLCRRKWDHQFHCCQCSGSGCFPGSGHVTLSDGKIIQINELQRGHEVLTAYVDGSIKPTKVIGYLDRRDDVIIRYREIVMSSGDQLTVSGSHVLFVSASNRTEEAVPRFASNVTIGDYLLTSTEWHLRVSMVTKITLRDIQGAYVPLTEAGTLLVDNVLTSCYASFPHDLAHAIMAPFRWFPSLACLAPENGVHPYVSIMKTVGRYLLPESWIFRANLTNVGSFVAL